MAAGRSVIGEAFIALRADNSHLQSEIRTGVEGAVKGVGPSLDAGTTKAGAFSGGLNKIAAAAGGLFVLRQGVDLLGGFVKQAEESNSIGRITAQVIAQTGSAAHISAAGVSALADSLSRKTGIDDEQIQKAENVILTFKSVRNEVGQGNDIFNRATKASLDLATVLGGDTAGAATQLSKALEDPIKGITALTRSGVTFTAAEKEKIKTLVETGHKLEAQKIILAAIEGQLGGTAEAGATTAGKLKVALGNVSEQIGNVMLPVITKGSQLLVSLFDKFQSLPAPVQKVITIVGVIAGALLALGIVIGPIAAAFSAIIPIITAVGAVLGVIFSPIGLLVAAIVILAIVIVKNWDTIKNAFFTAIHFISDLVSGLVDWIRDHFALIAQILLVVLTGPIGALVLLVVHNFDRIKELFGDLVDFIKSIPGRIVNLAGEFLQAGITIVEKIVEGIGHLASGAVDIAKSIANALIRAINKQVIDRLKGFEINAGFIHVKPFSFLPHLPEFASGGVVPGRTGLPQLVIAHGGERITPPGKGGGGDINIGPVVVEFHGVVPTPHEARVTGEAAAGGIAAELRRRNIRLAVRTA